MSWWVGIAFGVVLIRSRFCFFCNLREALEEREVRPLLGILLALAAGTLGAVVVFGAWIPDPGAGFLPQRGHISPASWPMVLGGVVFGFGMALSGSCISAHFYRLAEGSVASVIALATALLGFALGDLFWNPLYLHSYRSAAPLWFPRWLGFGGALLLQFAVLGLLAWWLWRRQGPRDKEATPARSAADAVLVERWPWWVGGIGVAAVATVALLRTQPLGVTAELTRQGHQLYERFAGPVRLEGVDGLRGCLLPESAALFSQNAILLLGLVVGSFIASLAANGFSVDWQGWRKVAGAALGGVLLGVGSRMALGCTIGTLYGGITALSLAGWLFGVGVVIGVVVLLPLRRKLFPA